MSAYTPNVKILGFSGYGEVDNVKVLMGSGSMTREHNISYIQPMDLPPPIGTSGAESRSRVKYSDGTVQLSGSISFDLNLIAMNLISVNRLFRRGYQFKVKMYDGNTGYELDGCGASSLSISGSSGGLITSSLSFVSNKDWKQIVAGSEETIVYNALEQKPLGYWASGNTNVRDWTLNMSQPVDPIFLNGIAESDDRFARYLKFGIINYNLDVTTYEQIYEHDQINISTASFTLSGNTKSESYNFGGINDLGMFSHSFEASANMTDGSSGIVIS